MLYMFPGHEFLNLLTNFDQIKQQAGNLSSNSILRNRKRSDKLMAGDRREEGWKMTSVVPSCSATTNQSQCTQPQHITPLTQALLGTGSREQTHCGHFRQWQERSVMHENRRFGGIEVIGCWDLVEKRNVVNVMVMEIISIGCKSIRNQAWLVPALIEQVISLRK